MILSAIAAMAKNRAIGVANDLPWDFPEDMQFFREKTKKSVLIMGRKTYDSFGGKPLPGRFHLVITRSPQSSPFSNVLFVQTWSEALKLAKEKAPDYGPEIFVIGGAEIYKMSLNFCDRLYLTVIDREFKGDAFFPEFSEKEWQLLESRPSTKTPELTFQTWQHRSE